jgi:seryl-tRNA synthetase
MLDINFIKENTELVKKAVESKKCKNVDIDELLKLNDEKKRLQTEVDNLRQKRNELSSVKEKPSLEKIEEVKKIKEEFSKLEETLNSVKEKYEELLLAVPNVTDPTMPVGKDEDENVSIKKWGKIPEFKFEVKDHVELGKTLDIIDVDKSAEISGSRFCYHSISF